MKRYNPHIIFLDNSAEMEQLRAEIERLRKECQESQEKLNESYNLIDELEFELETVSPIWLIVIQSVLLINLATIQLDFVEADRDHLQQQLKDTRAALDQLRSSTSSEEVRHNIKREDSRHSQVQVYDFTDTFLCSSAIQFNKFPSLTVTAVDGNEEAPPEDGSNASAKTGDDESFAAFAVSADDEDAADGGGDGEDHIQQASHSQSVGEEAVAKANEWKLRRQELHKRLEILHQSQQIWTDQFVAITGPNATQINPY